MKKELQALRNHNAQLKAGKAKPGRGGDQGKGGGRGRGSEGELKRGAPRAEGREGKAKKGGAHPNRPKELSGPEFVDEVNGEQVCFFYNTKSGCTRGSNCKFAHLCCRKGCGQSHPQFERNCPKR